MTRFYPGSDIACPKEPCADPGRNLPDLLSVLKDDVSIELDEGAVLSAFTDCNVFLCSKDDPEL